MPSKRQIYRSDDQKIKREAIKVIENLAIEYNFLLSSTATERKDRMNRLTTPGSDRLFYHDKIIIENDFFDQEFRDLPKDKRDKPVEGYFEDMAIKYGMDDNMQEPNNGKKVMIRNITTSNVKAMSVQDSLFIKVLFKISYEGVARNGFKYVESQRVAQLRLEKEGKNWRAYIQSVRFFNDIRDMEDRTGNVILLEDKVVAELKYEDANNNNDSSAIVSRNPVLRAFVMNDLWGLLSDENRIILVQPQFCAIEEFSKEGLALVCQDGYWGYIDLQGKTVIPCIYDSAEPFFNGKAKVQSGIKLLTIDNKGKPMK